MSKMIHCLIVEDATDLGRELKGAIQDLSTDLSIMAAPSAEEGILEMGRHSIDLLVTDFRLPGISGLELVKRVQRKCPGVKVILTTAFLDTQLEKEAEDLRVSQVIQKPVDLAEFRRVAAGCLGLEGGTLPTPPAAPTKVETKPVPQPTAEKEEDQTSKALFKLHQSLKARCTLWMDADGGIEKAFGDLPVDIPRDVVRQAGQQMAAAAHGLETLILSPGRASMHYQPGVSSDFMAVYAGEELLAAVFSPGLDAAQVAVKSELLLEGFDRVRNLPGGEKADAKKPAGSAKAAGTDGELEKLLGTPENVSRSDADDFWENAGTDAKPDLGNPDLLTFEQAQKMGLKIKK